MDESTVRIPAVAGQFYPASANSLRKQIKDFLPGKIPLRESIGCIMPHAGYVYSGKVAVNTAGRVVVKENVILLGPNHTGLGQPFSIMDKGSWQTPLGVSDINHDLAAAIMSRSDFLESDGLAHVREHSLEVELPILQYFRNDVNIVPIAFGADDFDALVDVGKAVAGAVKALKLEKKILLVASSDMTHYEPAAQARAKDMQALEAVAALDAKGLWQIVHKLGLTMCGYMPVIAMITAAKELGAVKGELVEYSNSGDVTGDDSSVVGYAGVIVY